MNKLIAHLSECIENHIQHIDRDTLPNSLSHIRKIKEDNQAILALARDEEPELIPHV